MYCALLSQLKKLNLFSFLLVLSLLSTPFQLKAQSPCYQSCEEANCCENNGNFQKRALLVGGAAIVGGILGAVIGNSDHHHSSSGSRGPSGSPGEQGPTGLVGPSGPGFTNDPGQTLTFNLSTGLEAEGGIFSVTLIPFATGPNGMTVEGAPVILTDISLPYYENFDPIVINNPVFGQYQIGVQAINTDSPYSIITTFTGNVVASKNNSTTDLGFLTFDSPDIGQELQGSLLFSYD